MSPGCGNGSPTKRSRRVGSAGTPTVTPPHLGYHPDEMETADEHDWEHVFNNPEHRILSVYTGDDEHIGEVHLAVEESLGDGQLSILIGRFRPLAPGLRNSCPPRRARYGLQGVRSLSRLGGHPGVQRSRPGHVPPRRLRPRGNPAQEPPPRGVEVRLRRHGDAGRRVRAADRRRLLAGPSQGLTHLCARIGRQPHAVLPQGRPACWSRQSCHESLAQSSIR